MTTDTIRSGHDLIGQRFTAQYVSAFPEFHGKEFVCTAVTGNNMNHPSGHFLEGNFTSTDGTEYTLWVREWEPLSEYVPAEGDKVIAYGMNVDSTGSFDGSIGIIDRINPLGSHQYRVLTDRNASQQHAYWFSRVEKFQEPAEAQVAEEEEAAEVPERVIGDLTIPANPTTDELLLIVERAVNDLTEQKGRAEVLSHELKRANERFHERDNAFEETMEKVSATLNENAKRREWCGEYARERDALNEMLPGPYYIEKGVRKFGITKRIEGTVWQEITVYVEAEDEDDAEDLANDKDNWVPEDGVSDDDFDPNDLIKDELHKEFDRNGFDSWKVSDSR
jgi:putative methionine-R-sulfoxide reductase with GAF domain